jgi:glucosamine kinase
LALVGAKAGIVVLAGTGAFAYGRARDGRELHLDGIGPLYGDHGGAYQIGLAAARAAGRAEWHERFATSLRETVVAACRALAGNPSDFDMTAYMLEPRDRSELASLAKLVNDDAVKGDRIARSIIVQAADDMVDTLRCVIDRLDMSDEVLPLVGTGGVAVHSHIYWERVTARILEFAPKLQPVLPDKPQVLGLILEMAEALGLNSEAFRDRLLYGEAVELPNPVSNGATVAGREI